MTAANQQRCADAYAAFLQGMAEEYGCAEVEAPVTKRDLPPELVVQQLWRNGLLGYGGETQGHGPVRVLDFGIWNRSVGPDFLRCELELAGRRIRGDIEIDPGAEDWERHGHGANPEFNNVVLHIVLTPPRQGWYTRNSLHQEVPVLHLDAARVRKALGLGDNVAEETHALCKTPLSDMPAECVMGLLRAAAAYRIQRKRHLFRCRAEHAGLRQTWYECWAETLGYRVNKIPMQVLAYRAPINDILDASESILLGTAGFLSPMLPESVESDNHLYHRAVWGKWWRYRPDFELAQSRAIPWRYAPLRPVNHPHRRVAALAVSVQRWQEIEPLLNAAGTQALTRLLTSLHHPFWDWHCTLTSPALHKRFALVGKDRINDFLINHIYVQDTSEHAWQSYLALKGQNLSSAVQRTSDSLFGDRKDMSDALKLYYVQQALLQIDADFCAHHTCECCTFPEYLARWKQI